MSRDFQQFVINHTHVVYLLVKVIRLVEFVRNLVISSSCSVLYINCIAPFYCNYSVIFIKFIQFYLETNFNKKRNKKDNHTGLQFNGRSTCPSMQRGPIQVIVLARLMWYTWYYLLLSHGVGQMSPHQRPSYLAKKRKKK